MEWPLRVEVSGKDQSGSIDYALHGSLGAGYHLYLVDRKSGQTVELGSSGSVGFGGSKEFAVIYSNLNRSYPNPFLAAATIEYQLPRAGLVSLKVYNISGQLVKTLVDGERKAGYYSAVWNGRNGSGQGVSSGVYIVRLSSGDGTITKKLAKIR